MLALHVNSIAYVYNFFSKQFQHVWCVCAYACVIFTYVNIFTVESQLCKPQFESIDLFISLFHSIPIHSNPIHFFSVCARVLLVRWLIYLVILLSERACSASEWMACCVFGRSVRSVVLGMGNSFYFVCVMWKPMLRVCVCAWMIVCVCVRVMWNNRTVNYIDKMIWISFTMSLIKNRWHIWLDRTKGIH